MAHVSKCRSIAIGALALVALAGCKREATGQVAAVVDGDEITLQEINQQIGNAQLPNGVDRKAVQQAALQQLIDRRLLAKAAMADGIDKSPDFLLRKRQLEEALMVQMMGDKAGRAMRMPDTAKIDAYIASRPHMFAERTIYKVDRISFPMPGEMSKLKEFEADHSMQAVQTRINAMGLPSKRNAIEMDSAIVAPEIMARLKSLPAGEPFLVPEAGMVSAGVITGSRPDPLTGEAARPIAVQMMRNEDLNKIMRERLASARSTAKIEYQSGFSPPAQPGAKPAPAKK